MNIKSPAQLKEAIQMAVDGDKDIITDIGDYITYNYYIYVHTKADSPEDIENEKIYTEFKINHPDLFAEVELWVDYKFKKFKND